MTAASPACSPTSSRSSPLCLPACHRHLRKSEAFQTNLRLGSAPGVWLLLGAVVVLVGMSVAVAGYVSAVPKQPKLVSARRTTHVDKMKLAGPVVMGVGLFIFICAATLLYENRDRDVLRPEKPDDLEDLKGGSCWDDSQEQPSIGCQDQWEYTDGEQASLATPAHILPLSSQSPLLPRALLQSNRHNISSGPSLPPPPDVGGTDKEEVDREEEEKGSSTLLTRVLHHQEPTPHPSSPCPSISHCSVYSDSSNSSETNFNVRTDSSEMPQH